MPYKNALLSVLLMLIIGIAGWVTLIYRVNHNNGQKTLDIPDSYMEGVTALIIDKQGKLSMRIVTPKMIHFPQNDTAKFTAPKLTLYRQSPQPWFIQSNHAIAENGIDNLDFWDHVTIHHAADASNPATLIKTSRLIVHPNHKTAETDKPITLLQPNVTINGIGMRANMETGRIKLLSQARGEYVP